MIPETGKKYRIVCFGPYDYNQFRGVGSYTGKKTGSGDINDPFVYEFYIEGKPGVLGFYEEDITCEALLTQLMDTTILKSTVECAEIIGREWVFCPNEWGEWENHALGHIVVKTSQGSMVYCSVQKVVDGPNMGLITYHPLRRDEVHEMPRL